MGVEVKALGVKCNIRCKYCYQDSIREAAKPSNSYDLAKIKVAITAQGRPFTVFGGEPLLMRRADLEDLWSWGLANFGRNSLQTNGTLIDADLIRMFKRYKVHVGISVDGPGALNDARWAGSLERTRRATAKTENAILSLCREHIRPALIVTLSRSNAAAQALPALMNWFQHLEDIGVRRVRLHILESETDLIRQQFGLSPEENLQALLSLYHLKLKKLKFDLFADMSNMLRGQDEKSACVWMNCDPYTTPAVSGIEGNGQRSNCSRTNKDGVDYVKAERMSFERYLALYLTPQDAGGCKGCRFFLMCKGQCPGNALDGDWRNKTEHCGVWKRLYEVLETDLLAAGEAPLSVDPRRPRIELSMVTSWARGENNSVANILRTPH
jgi:uncharacterized protein